ncbi:MAG TPA: hypothetical protein ENI94_01195 [Gammaproteobacteria bacterium]|nr:hypothetical protein [Gammaproteobacteria bacterium]
MKPITFPLNPKMKNLKVGDLHQALAFLGSSIIDKENVNQRFGASTRTAVKQFQLAHQLPATGRVDKATARAINRELADRGVLNGEPGPGGDLPQPDSAGEEKRFVVQGEVVRPDGTPLQNRVVRALDRVLCTYRLLGEARTDNAGRYRIDYDPEELAKWGKSRADLKVEVRDASSDTILASSPLLLQAQPQERVDFSIGDQPYTGLDEYSRLDQALIPALDEVEELTCLDAMDVLLLARQVNLTNTRVAFYVKANRWAADLELPAQVFFGLLRESATLRLDALFASPFTTLWAGLEQAHARNIISIPLDELLKVKLFDTQKAYLAHPEHPYSQLLQTTTLDTIGREVFTSRLVSGKDTGDGFWQALIDEDGFSEEEVRDLQAMFEVQSFTGDNTSLTIHLRKDLSLHTPREVAAFGVEQWRDEILSGAGVEIPEWVFPGGNDAQRREAYAYQLAGVAEMHYPTASLRGQMERNPVWAEQPLTAFLVHYEDFEFEQQRMTNFLTSQPEALDLFPDPETGRRELLRLEQLFHLIPANNRLHVIQPLWAAGLVSAPQLAASGRQHLVRSINGRLSKTLIDQIYRKAVHITAVALNVYMRYNPQLNGPSLPVMRSVQLKGEAALAQESLDLPEWETLFGSADACACTHCESALSPAAYLVDIMDFLIRAVDDTGKTGLDAFLERRPELGRLKLTCENSDTSLPQIDLVNEILEHIVVFGVNGDIPESYAAETTWETDALEIQPEYLLPAAYDTLREAVYPFGLPFDLWFVEGRRYLEQMGVSRYDLMQAMPPHADVGPNLLAAEALGLSPGELDSIRTPRLRPENLATYWGLSLANGSVVKQLTDVELLLQQAEIDHETLLRLLNTRYLNPDGVMTVTFADDSCALDKATLSGGQGAPLPDGVVKEFLDRLHRFLRLQQRLGWTVYELDHVLDTLEIQEFNEPLFFSGLATIQKLKTAYRLTVEELCTWWRGLDTFTYEESLPSQYEALFLDPLLLPDTHTGTGPDLRHDVFALTPDRSDILLTSSTVLNPWLAEFIDGDAPVYRLNADYAPTIQSATQLTAEELAFLVEHILPKDSDNHVRLDLDNLSLVYRIASFARTLGITIPDYWSLTRLTGVMPLTMPGAAREPGVTADFCEMYKAIDSAAYSIEDLMYLLLHDPDTATVRSPTHEEMDLLLQTLSVAYAGVEDAEEAIEAVKNNNETRATFTQSLGDTLGLDPSLLDELLFKYHAELGDVILDHLLLAANPDLQSVPVPQTDFYSAFEGLYKFAQAWNLLGLDPAYLAFVVMRGSVLGWADLMALPLAETSDAGFPAWYRFTSAMTLQSDLFTTEHSLFDLISAIHEEGLQGDALLAQTSDWTGWSLEDLSYLAGPAGFAWELDDFADERWLLTVQKVLNLVGPLGAMVSQAHAWTSPELGYNETQAIKETLRLAYGEGDWLNVLADIQDALRTQRRDALLGYLMHREGLKDSTAFYNRYLIDPERDPCDSTSRIVAGHAAVQLFVQRILLNLEPTLAFAREDAESWQWRKNYRVWEAGRKIFLYPENWIEAELRDNQSVFFKELEEALWQEDVTQEYAERLYLEYTYKFNEVSQLDIIGVYEEIDEERGTTALHTFGRTFDISQTYWYRRWEDQARWTSWERIELDIEGDHLVPIVYQGRLYLFWPVFEFTNLEGIRTGGSSTQEIEALRQEIDDLETRQREIEQELAFLRATPKLEPAEEDLEEELRLLEAELITKKSALEAAEKENEESVNPPDRYDVKIDLAWSEYRDGRWSAKSLSKMSGFYSTYYEARRHYLTGWVSADQRLYVAIHAETLGSGYGLVEPEYLGHFYLDDCVGDMLFSREEPTMPQAEVAVSGAIQWYSKLSWGSPTYSVPYLELQVNGENDTRRLLEAGGTLQYAHQYGSGGNESSPFFFADQHRTYFVRVTVGAAGIRNYTQFDQSFLPSLSAEKLSMIANIPSPAYAANGHFTGQSNAVFSLEEAGDVPQYFPVNHEYLNDLLEDETTGNYLPGLQLETQEGIAQIKPLYVFTRFYHPTACLFLKQLRRYGVDGLLNPNPDWDEDSENLYRQLLPNETFDFEATYDPNTFWVNRNFTKDVVADRIDFDHNSAYGSYNWELFFHIPLLIATRLMQNRRFSEARRWLNYIFDPTHTDGEAPARYWKIKPFFEEQSKGPSEDIQELTDLLASGDYDLERQIEAWEADPFNPHVIARLRIGAYMRTTVMKYLDCLIAEADALFALDTREAINEAEQLYLVAVEMLGERPATLPAKDRPAMTADELLPHLTVEIPGRTDLLDPLSSLLPVESVGIALSQLGLPSSSGHTITIQGATSSYTTLLRFCLPANDKLLEYWDRVTDRLFKIRHCMNLSGQARELALFSPPIDPALLVRASAAGLDIASVLASLYAPLPHYRFNFLMQKALEFCSEVRNLGGALLAALEKKDGEELSLLRSTHEVSLLESIRELKKKSVDEAVATLEGLQKTLAVSEFRSEYYSNKVRISKRENENLTKQEDAAKSQFKSTNYSLLASAGYQLPNVTVEVGGLPKMQMQFGGVNLGGMAQALSSFWQAHSSMLSFSASKASTMAGYDRRWEDWSLQVDLSKKEIEQLNKQILAAEIRQQIAERDLENHEKQISQAEEVENFLKLKFSNQTLYSWMVSKISALYFQAYQLAHQLARQAEKASQHELGGDQQSQSYIGTAYWDSLKKGLTAGEQLAFDLRRMEAAYIENNSREYEITRHVSLALLDPAALLQLTTEGLCFFSVPEALFDLDCPGHYMRRIKSLSMSIPCITGPYTSVNCTLTLVGDRIRKETSTTAGYAYIEPEDTRFQHNSISQSISTSSGQNDSGVFELNFRDERYVPFEGRGAISDWNLKLTSALPTFDWSTITDVILHVRYTAREGGEALRTATTGELTDALAGLPLRGGFSARHEFSTDWNTFIHPPGESDEAVLNLDLSENRFPYFAREAGLSIQQIELVAILKDTNSWNDTDVGIVSPGGDDSATLVSSSVYAGHPVATVSYNNAAPGTWSINVPTASLGGPSEWIDDFVILVTYVID